MRTGHLFLQCGDRHNHKDMTLICAMCGQTQSRGHDTYLGTVLTDIVMRTGHLCVQCVDRHSHEDRTLICAMFGQTVTRTGYLFVHTVDRHSHEDRTLICAVCGQTWSQGQDTSPHAPRKIDLHQICPI